MNKRKNESDDDDDADDNIVEETRSLLTVHNSLFGRKTMAIEDDQSSVLMSRTIRDFHRRRAAGLTSAFALDVFIQREPDWTIDGELMSRPFVKPIKLKTKLFDHQIEGLEFVREKLDADMGVLVADEPGLGKTMLCLSFLIEQKNAALRCWLKARRDHLITTDQPVDEALHAKLNEVKDLIGSMKTFHHREVASMPDYDKSSEAMRTRVRGPPALVVMTPSALPTWISQIYDGTEGLSMAVLSNSDRFTLDVYIDNVSNRRNKYGAVRSITNYTPEHLHSFDVLLITLGQFDELKNDDTQLYQRIVEFKLFTHSTRARKSQEIIRELNLLIDSSMYGVEKSKRAPDGIYFDHRCRAVRPIGSCNRVSLSGRPALWGLEFSTLIVDEAHKAASSMAARPRVLATVAARNFIMVTATPCNNEILEFATLLWLMRITPLLQDHEWTSVNKRQNHLLRKAAAAATPPPLLTSSSSSSSSSSDSFDVLETLRTSPAALLANAESTLKHLGQSGVVDEKTLSPLGLLSLMLTRCMIARRQADVDHYRDQYVVHEYVVQVPILTPVEAEVNKVAIRSATMKSDGFSFTLIRQAAVAPCVISHGTAKERIVTAAQQELVDLIDSTPALSTHSTYVNTIIAIFKDSARIKPTEKVIVSSMMVEVIKVIERRLEMEGIPFYSLTGTNSDAMCRSRVIDEFARSTTHRVLLMSMRISESFNIPCANHVIVDTWFSPGLRAQAAGRIKRLSQRNPHLYIWTILVDGTVAKYEQTLSRRKQIQSDVLMFQESGDGEGAAAAAAAARQPNMITFAGLRTCSEIPYRQPMPEDIIDQWAEEDPQNRARLTVAPGHYDAEKFPADWAQTFVGLGYQTDSSKSSSSSSRRRKLIDAPTEVNE